MKTHYTVSEVAAEFGVTVATVRDWIDKRKLIAIQPAGAGGAYRIPARALDVFRDQSAGLRGKPGRPSVIGQTMLVDNIYVERIAPVLAETGLTADQLLRQMMTDMSLVARYPSFASDYSSFVMLIEQHASMIQPVMAQAANA